MTLDCSDLIRWLTFFTAVVFWADVLGAQQDEGKKVVPATVPGGKPAPIVDKLEFTRWSGELNIPDPVAISFDNRGAAYVTQTLRRKSQDLDIRNYRSWIPDDVGLRSIDAKRAFYQNVLAPIDGKEAEQRLQFEDHNGDGKLDYRDLTVLSERIHVVKDTNADGVADSKSVYADGFHTEVTGIAAGVLWHDGHVYATIAPDVWKLSDTNHDGTADHREVIATGFGLHIAYAGHDMHGLTIGPDGKIYWTIGDKGIHVVSREGRRFYYPNQGGVLRCNPDGSDFEVFAHGLRNVQEIAFDQYGNLFGVDNDADQPGERERVVYIVEGMDAGWRCNYQYRGNDYNPWTDEKLWVPWFSGQAAYIVPPIAFSLNGPAGFAFNPGTALSPAYRNFFFLTGAPGGEQRAFRMQPSGASFRVLDEHDIGRGLPIVGINFGPDGALYGVDWGGGYPLNQKGAVWKIDVSSGSETDERRQTRSILADGFKQRNAAELVSLLGHADQRVRLGAQFALVQREAVADLEAATANLELSQLARIHAVWGVGQLCRMNDANSQAHVLKLLEDPDPEIRVQAVRTLAGLKSTNARRFVECLSDAEPRVRFHAAIAIQRHPSTQALPELIRLARGIRLEDTYMRHAIAMGMSSSPGPELAELSAEGSPIVRMIAVIALRHQLGKANAGRKPMLGRFLNDSNHHVATEAARAVYAGLGRNELSPVENDADVIQLAHSLPTTRVSNEAFIRRALGAAFWLGDKTSAACVAQYAARTDAPVELRVEALEALAQWEAPPKLDRVDGRSRDYPRHQRIANIEPVTVVLDGLFSDESQKIRAATLRAARSVSLPLSAKAKDDLAELVTDSRATAALRIEALDTLEAQNYHGLDAVTSAAAESDSMAVRMRALSLMTVDPDKALARVMRVLTKSRQLREKQHAILLLAELESSAADTYLSSEFAKLGRGDAAPGTELELIEAIRRRARHDSTLAEQLAQFDAKRLRDAEGDPITSWSECLNGGDPAAGRKTFNTHISAACVRCHRVGNSGSTVGPDMDGIALKRDGNHLLRSIISPGSDIDPKYQSHVLALHSGEVVQGLLLRKTEEVTVLADVQGKEFTVKNDDIDESVVQKVSIMPDMTNTLTRREIRDLIAYLKTLTKPAKK